MHGTNLFYIFVILAGYVTCKSVHKREINRDTKVNVVGSKVEPDRVHLYKHLVQLRYRCIHVCGGAIISARHVLTAAHCVVEKDPRELTITAGIATRYEAKGEVRDVFAVVIHSGYKPRSLLNDIAIITLQEQLDVTKYTVVKLPEVGEKFEGSVVDVAGWGSTSELTYGYFTVTKNKAYTALSQICVKPFPDIMIYKGDSGSPAVVRSESDVTLVGLVSSYFYFTNVAHLRPWIDDSIAEGEQLFNIGNKHLSNLPKNDCAVIDATVRKLVEIASQHCSNNSLMCIKSFFGI